MIISYETPNKELGVRILAALNRYLREEYKKIVDYFKNEIKIEMALKQSEIDTLKDNKQYSEAKVKRLTDYIEDLKAEIEFINRNTSYLNKERERYELFKKKVNSMEN